MQIIVINIFIVRHTLGKQMNEKRKRDSFRNSQAHTYEYYHQINKLMQWMLVWIECAIHTFLAEKVIKKCFVLRFRFCIILCCFFVFASVFVWRDDDAILFPYVFGDWLHLINKQTKIKTTNRFRTKINCSFDDFGIGTRSFSSRTISIENGSVRFGIVLCVRLCVSNGPVKARISWIPIKIAALCMWANTNTIHGI